MEFVEEVDVDGNVLAVHPKSKLKERMFLHKTSLVIPRAKNGSFIISKRAENKHPYPGTWMCAIGGGVRAGESFLEAAHRETKEEAGVELDLVPVGSFKYEDEKFTSLFSIFTTVEPVELHDDLADKSEVQFFKEMTMEEIRREIEENPTHFAPTFLAALKNFTP